MTVRLEGKKKFPPAQVIWVPILVGPWLTNYSILINTKTSGKNNYFGFCLSCGNFPAAKSGTVYIFVRSSKNRGKIRRRNTRLYILLCNCACAANKLPEMIFYETKCGTFRIKKNKKQVSKMKQTLQFSKILSKITIFLSSGKQWLFFGTQNDDIY